MEKPDFRNYENSEEGLAQYDAEVATYNRQQEGPKIGTELVDVVEKSFQQISQVPVIKQGFQFLGAGVRFIDETMSQDKGTGGMIYRTYQDLQKKAQQGGEFYANKFGVDPRLGRFVGGEILDAAATAGLGKASSVASKIKLPPSSPQLATAGVGQMSLTPSGGSFTLSPQVMESRGNFKTQGQWDVTQPKRIDNARDAADNAREVLENIQDANPGVKASELKKTIPEYKAAEKRLNDAMPKISSEESNVLTPGPGREHAYPRGKPRAVEIKGIFLRDSRLESLKLGVDEVVEQIDLHHKFPKGISSAFFNRARDFIESGKMTFEELKDMASRAQKVGLEPGDVETDLLPMFKTPHDSFHAEMRAQPSFQFPGDNLEISKTKLTQRLRQVKTKKDLDALWDELLSEDAKYLYETAEVWQPLDKTIKSVSPKFTGKAKSKL